MTIVPNPCHGFSLTENIVSTFAAIKIISFSYFIFPYVGSRVQKRDPPFRNPLPVPFIPSAAFYNALSISYIAFTMMMPAVSANSNASRITFLDNMISPLSLYPITRIYSQAGMRYGITIDFSC